MKLTYILSLYLTVCACLQIAHAETVSLTKQQKRDYLNYYSPVIFKQADETSTQDGQDWITNFFFDGDTYLANNKENWERLDAFVSGNVSMEIRPTLYSSIIEFQDHALENKSVILLYHVYHAKQQYSIHDWERIEIRIDNVTGPVGTSEEINYVVITRHSLHNSRNYPHEDLNFMETDSGKHVMIWQADQKCCFPGTAELRFVEDSWSDIASRNKRNRSARVDVNGTWYQNFHYIFVNQVDQQAVDYWNAEKITVDNALQLASGREQSDRVDYDKIKRVQYELQDLADIIHTHLDPKNWKDVVEIEIVSPLLDENGNTEVGNGIHQFYRVALDTEDPDEDRSGYVRKHWFWGVYHMGSDEDRFYDELGPSPWHQHLYFAHNGERCDGTVADQLANCGIFLGKGEYKNWLNEGGFDGRWVQLFQD